MKKFAVCMSFLALIAGISALFWGKGGNGANNVPAENAAYLRVHIRANSNSEADQAVKYLVRDAVVEALTPALADCKTKQSAVETVEKNLVTIEETADRVLKANNYFYGARASVRQEEFPTRVYEGVTLASGVYDALIVELGTGEGDNWWCVVYPTCALRRATGTLCIKASWQRSSEIFSENNLDESGLLLKAFVIQ